MPEKKFHQLPVHLPIPVLHQLIDLQRVRGPIITSEAMDIDPVKKSGVPSMTAVIRALIVEAHRREFGRA